MRPVVIAALVAAPASALALPSTTSFQAFAFPEQTGVLVLELDVTPSTADAAAVIGLSSGAADAFGDFAVTLRFSDTGAIQAFNGSAYGASQPMSYAAGTSYHVTFAVRLASGDYGVVVEPDGMAAVEFVGNASFRDALRGVGTLDHWGMVHIGASIDVTNVTITNSEAQPTYDIEALPQAPVIDGDPADETVFLNPLVLSNSQTGTQTTYSLGWTALGLYVCMEADDDQLAAAAVTSTDAIWQDDALEIMFDTGHDHGQVLGSDDFKIMLNVAGVLTVIQGEGSVVLPLDEAQSTVGTLNTSGDTDGGFVIEAFFAWAEWGVSPPVEGTVWGLEILADDRRDDGSRTFVEWAETTPSDGTPNLPDGFGDAHFVPAPPPPEGGSDAGDPVQASDCDCAGDPGQPGGDPAGDPGAAGAGDPAGDPAGGGLGRANGGALAEQWLRLQRAWHDAAAARVGAAARRRYSWTMEPAATSTKMRVS